MSPPVSPVLLIRPSVRSAKTTTVGTYQRAGRVVRWDRHSATKARAPVVSINHSASIAAASCLSSKEVGTLGSRLSMIRAPKPLKNVGMATRAPAAKMIRPLRLRSRLSPTKESNNRLIPMIVLMIGK